MAGPAGTVWPLEKCVHRWSLQGVWEHIFEELIAQDIVDGSTLMLDSTTIKVHQHGSGAKKGAAMHWDAAGED